MAAEQPFVTGVTGDLKRFCNQPQQGVFIKLSSAVFWGQQFSSCNPFRSSLKIKIYRMSLSGELTARAAAFWFAIMES